MKLYVARNENGHFNYFAVSLPNLYIVIHGIKNMDGL